MATCASCGTSILWGGHTANGLRFCNQTCLHAGAVVQVAPQVPDKLVADETRRFHGGRCPKCGGPGPVDVREAHYVWSAVVFTRWATEAQIACASCGRKQRWLCLFVTLLFGWWGFGVILVPIQIFKNLCSMFGGDPLRPSGKLTDTVRLLLAEQALKSKG